MLLSQPTYSCSRSSHVLRASADSVHDCAGFFIMISATTLAKKVMLRVLPPIYRRVVRPLPAHLHVVSVLRDFAHERWPPCADLLLRNGFRMYPPALRRLWQPPMHTLKVRAPSPSVYAAA